MDEVGAVLSVLDFVFALFDLDAAAEAAAADELEGGGLRGGTRLVDAVDGFESVFFSSLSLNDTLVSFF